MLENITTGAEVLFAPGPLTWLLFGVITGFVVGAIPGFSGGTAAALLLPYSIGLPLESALVLIGGIYAGSMFAGSIPAILINAPGEPGSAATALDGYPLARQGRAGYAIGLARTASAAGGVLSASIVLSMIGPMSSLSLRFGARELFVLTLFGLVVISAVLGKDTRKGFISALTGLLIASMSANVATGQPRLTFGFSELYTGVPFVPAVIGLFAITQMFIVAQQAGRPAERSHSSSPTGGSSLRGRGRDALAEALDGVRGAFRFPVTIVRSSAVGLLLGAIPGVGTSVTNFISYGIARSRSRSPERFGNGAPEGVVASEASDNACASGSLIPTLALGIPGSATGAIILSALYLHGIQPGPRLMVSHAGEVYALLLAMIVASLLILPVGVALGAPLALVTRVKPAYLVPAVILLCLVGAFSYRQSMFDVGLTVVFGVLGYLMNLSGYPVVPMVLGLILGPIAEENFLRALDLGNNQWSYFVGSPISVALWIALIALVGFIAARSVLGRRRTRTVEEAQKVQS